MTTLQVIQMVLTWMALVSILAYFWFVWIFAGHSFPRRRRSRPSGIFVIGSNYRASLPPSIALTCEDGTEISLTNRDGLLFCTDPRVLLVPQSNGSIGVRER